MLIEELAAAVAMSVAIVATAVLLLIEAVFTLLGVVIELVLWLVLRDRTAGKAVRARAAVAASAAGSARTRLTALLRSRWVRRIAIASAVCLGVTLLGVLTLNFFFFDWSVRKILDGADARSGIAVGFAETDGNLLTGRIRLLDVTLVRRSDPLTVFDARAKEVEIDLDLPSMIWGDRRVELAHVAGLSGTVERLAKRKPAPWYAKRNVHIDRLVISDANIAWVDHTRPRDGTPLRVNLALDEFVGERLQTRWIAFDLLFRTNGHGRVDGKPFAVTNEPTPTGRQTVWRFEEVPATLLGDFVGGPIAGFTEGRADVVATTVHHDPTRGLDMDWRLTLTGVRAEVPPSLEGWRRRLAAAFVDYVEEHGERLPLAFTFQLDASGFDGAASPEAAGLWTAVAETATKEVARAVGVTPEHVGELKDRVAEKLRGFRRKRAE